MDRRGNIDLGMTNDREKSLKNINLKIKLLIIRDNVRLSRFLYNFYLVLLFNLPFVIKLICVLLLRTNYGICLYKTSTVFHCYI